MSRHNRRKRLTELTNELRHAREELEDLLAEEYASGASSLDFGSSRRLRQAFHNVIALDEMKRAEKRAEEAAKPSTAELFAEAMQAASERSRRHAALSDFVQDDDTDNDS